MKNFQLLIGAFVLISTMNAHADESPMESLEALIKQKSDACLETGYTTLAMNRCAEEALDRWDTELNRVYKVLISRLDNTGQTRLREAQRAWLRYRDAEHANIRELMSHEQGSLYGLVRIHKHSQIVRHRVNELLDHVHTLER